MRTTISLIAFIFCISCIQNNIKTEKLHTYENDSSIYIDNFDYDFGIIEDSVHTLKRDFYLYNKSSDTCRIIRIEKGCGCIRVQYDKKEIFPRDSVRISVDVDIEGYNVFFERGLNVFTSLSINPLPIYIRACRKAPKVLLENEFPYKVSKNIRLSMNSLLVGFIKHGHTASKSINIINTSNETLNLKGEILDGPDYISIYCPESIEPHMVSRIIVSFDLRNIDSVWGEQDITILFRENNERVFSLKVYGIITEDFNFDGVKPRIMAPITCFQLDENDRAHQIIKEFELFNCGNSDLIIRDIKANCSDVTCTMSTIIIKPDDRAKLTVSLPSYVMKKESKITIGITCNDATEPFKNFYIIN